MALRKLDRSCQTPPGWRLATVEEVKVNLDSIRRDNLLGDWDRARLLNGWIGGSGYDFKVEEAFRSCLGYMLLIESPTPEISNADGRNAAIYSEVPTLSEEGRSAALLLCSEDWNQEVLYWLNMPGEDPAIWEGDEIKEASEVISAMARKWHSVLAKSRVPETEFLLSSLEALRTGSEEFFKTLADNIKKFLNVLIIKNQCSEQRKITNDILEKVFPDMPEIDDYFWDEIGFTEDLKMFKDLGFDTGMRSSTWEVIADTVWHVIVEFVTSMTVCFLCRKLYDKVVMHSNPQSSLIYYAYRFIKTALLTIKRVVKEAAEEANSDFKKFAENLRDKWFSIVSSKGESDVLIFFLVPAAKKADVTMVKRLIENGVKPSKTYDYNGKKSLHYAAELDDESKGLEIAQMLLAATEEKESLANEFDSEKRTPLHAAVDEGHYEMCELLLQNEAASQTSTDHEDGGSVCLVDVRDNNGDTPLDIALQNDAPVNMVARLLSRSSQPESYFKKLQDLSLFLREYSRMGYLDLVQKLLDGGADPFQGDDEGKTSLHYAAEGEGEYAAWEIIERLLHDKKKGSPNWEKTSVSDKYGRNVLHVAAFLGRRRLCRRILESNIKMIDSKDRDGQSAIFYAVAGPDDDPRVLLELLLSRKRPTYQVFVRDFSQTTPLHVAAARGNRRMVRELLWIVSEKECQNYVEAADVLGQTALHRAASAGYVEIVQNLIENGAHPLKERDCNGKTALHFAGQADDQNAVKIAELFLQKCESESKEQKSLLLFASAVGVGGKPNPSLEEYLEGERRAIRKTLRHENLLRVAARLGNIDMTREFITRGANIALICDKDWIATLLTKEERNNVKNVLERIKNIVEQGADKPALQDNLGRSPFAIGLAALFLNPFMKSPVTVGISGEWGMGKSSVMVQTESILLKTAAQLAFTSSCQNDDFTQAGESKLSVTGKARRRKIGNAIKRLESKRWIGLNIIDDMLYSIKRVMNFTAEISKTILSRSRKQATEEQDIQKPSKPSKPSKATDPNIFSKLHSGLRKFWSALRVLWEESAPFELSEFNSFLAKKYEIKYHQILKSLAVIDRRDMFEEDEENGFGNQTAGEMSWEENSLQGTTPSILTVQYNAWHYRNETEAWAGLAVKITEEIEATMTVAHKLRTSWIYNWRNRRDSICLKVIFPFILALVVAIFISIVVWLVLGTAHSKDIKKLKYGGVPVSMVVAAWGLGKSVMSFVKPISSQVVDYICLPDHSQKLGYHQKVIDDINFLKEQLRYKHSWKWEVFAFIWCCVTWSWDQNYVPRTKVPKLPPAFGDNLRIIVFVDDLDRCEENVILQVLSAVNLVLATCEINVILSMENSMIQRAIIRKHGNKNNRANNNFNEDLADKYLRKIIQLPLHLAEPSDLESRDFLQSQLGMWDGRKGTDDKKDSTGAHRKGNPKFQIEIWNPKKPRPEALTEQQRAFSFSDTSQEGESKSEEQQGESMSEEHETNEKPERVSQITQIYTYICALLHSCVARSHNSQSEGDEAPGMEQAISTDEGGADKSQEERQTNEKADATHEIEIDGQPIGRNEQHNQIEKAVSVSPITQIYSYVRALLDSCNLRSRSSQSGVGEAPENRSSKRKDEEANQEQGEDSKEQRNLSLIISSMLIPKYSQGEINAFHFLHARCTGSRKLPREWKCLLAYHRLAWNILSLTPDVDPVEGWQVQLISWIFVCWEWRDLITTLIKNWKNLGVLRKWKVVEENTSGPSLREIVEHYIDDRWPEDKKSTSKKEDAATESLSRPEEVEKSTTKKEDDAAIESLSSPEEVEKISDILPEENLTAEKDDYLREALRRVLKEQGEMREFLSKVLKEQEEMREVLRKNLKEQEEMREVLRKNLKEQENTLDIIKKKVFEEEEDKVEGEESSVLQYITAEEKTKNEKEEREEWKRLRETLRRYNVSMDGIQAFQKFRFYCQPGYLPWPLPEQA